MKNHIILKCVIVLICFTSCNTILLRKKKKYNMLLPKYITKHYSLLGEASNLKNNFTRNRLITILEYLEYLSKLIDKNIKHYNTHLPKSESWLPNETLVKNYAFNPSYNNHPVVNISKNNAEVFCKWLVQKYINTDFRWNCLHNYNVALASEQHIISHKSLHKFDNNIIEIIDTSTASPSTILGFRPVVIITRKNQQVTGR